MSKLVELWGSFDRQTAGWKTYLGLLLAALGLLLGWSKQVDDTTAAAIVTAGVTLATVGKVASDTRPPTTPTPLAPGGAL